MTSRKRYRAWKAFKRIQGRVLDARGRRTFPVLASPKFPFLYLSNAWGWRKNIKRFGTLSVRLFAKKVRKHVKPEYVRWRHNCIWGRWGAQTRDANSKSFIVLFIIFLIIVFLNNNTDFQYWSVNSSPCFIWEYVLHFEQWDKEISQATSYNTHLFALHMLWRIKNKSKK